MVPSRSSRLTAAGVKGSYCQDSEGRSGAGAEAGPEHLGSTRWHPAVNVNRGEHPGLMSELDWDRRDIALRRALEHYNNCIAEVGIARRCAEAMNDETFRAHLVDVEPKMRRAMRVIIGHVAWLDERKGPAA